MVPNPIRRSAREASGCSEVVQAEPPSPAIDAASSSGACREALVAAGALPFATANSAGPRIRNGGVPRLQEPAEARGMERQRGVAGYTTR